MKQLLLLGLLCRFAMAGDFTGLQRIKVSIEKLPDGFAADAGYSQSAFQTDAEIKLRKAGITVVEDAHWQALIVVKLRGLRHADDPLWSCSVTVKLYEDVTVKRTGNKAFVPVWEASTAGYIGLHRLRHLRADVDDLVDLFINEWLKDNPIQK